MDDPLKRECSATLHATKQQTEIELQQRYQTLFQYEEGNHERQMRQHIEELRVSQEVAAQSQAAALKAELNSANQRAQTQREHADHEIARLTAIIDGYNASSQDGGDQVRPDHTPLPKPCSLFHSREPAASPAPAIYFFGGEDNVVVEAERPDLPRPPASWQPTL